MSVTRHSRHWHDMTSDVEKQCISLGKRQRKISTKLRTFLSMKSWHTQDMSMLTLSWFFIMLCCLNIWNHYRHGACLQSRSKWLFSYQCFSWMLIQETGQPTLSHYTDSGPPERIFLTLKMITQTTWYLMLDMKMTLDLLATLRTC